jgi:hypothetical protein
MNAQEICGTILVKCFFQNGGFSEERYFQIPHDEGYYSVTAWLQYCFDPSSMPLSSEEPPPGETIPGAIEAWGVKHIPEKNLILVNLSDGENCEISPEDVLIRDGKKLVPVQS